MDAQKKVLFICTQNSCRSQMAEAFLRELGGDKYAAFSAGLNPAPIHPMAIEAMAMRGIDISGQQPKGVDEFLGKQHMNMVVTVCDAAKAGCPRVWPTPAEVKHWPFEDPAAFRGRDEDKLKKFCQIRDQIEQKIRQWINEDE